MENENMILYTRRQQFLDLIEKQMFFFRSGIISKWLARRIIEKTA
jgi:hypothetical protein